MTGIVAHTYPEWWLKLTGQAAHWSTDYSVNLQHWERRKEYGMNKAVLIMKSEVKN